MKAHTTQTILCLPVHFLAPKGEGGPRVSSYAGQTWRSTKGILNGINCTCYSLSFLLFLYYQGLDTQLQAIIMKSY